MFPRVLGRLLLLTTLLSACAWLWANWWAAHSLSRTVRPDDPPSLARHLRYQSLAREVLPTARAVTLASGAVLLTLAWRARRRAQRQREQA